MQNKRYSFAVLLMLFSLSQVWALDPCTLDGLKEIKATNEKNKAEILERNLHYEAFRYYRDYQHCSNSFYSLPYVQQMAVNLITYQDPKHGGWDKKSLSDGFSAKSSNEKFGNGTIDNGQSTGQVEFISRALVHSTQKNEVTDYFKNSIRLALTNFFFEMQKKNGGIPMSYPEQPTFEAYTKINQNSMVQVLQLFKNVAEESRYSWLEDKIRKKARKHYEAGIKFLLKSQIQVNGALTGWAQQYDGYTPARARTFEVPAIASTETLGVVEFLLQDYTASNSELRFAVDSAVQWLKKVKIQNVKVTREEVDPGLEKGAVHCEVSEGGSIWSRYYSLDTELPFFAKRTQTGAPIDIVGPSARNAKDFCSLWDQYVREADERSRFYSWMVGEAGFKRVFAEYDKVVAAASNQTQKKKRGSSRR